jgi:hypothetical protein
VGTMLVETEIDHGAPVKTALGISLLASLLVASIALGSSHYTKAHLDALASRVGMVYWIASTDSRTPIFLSAPTKSAPSFRARENEYFEITELVGQKEINPYYKVKFDSGKVGYVSPEAFLDELNLTILSADPRASEKKKTAEVAETERKRVEWIRSQPWTPAVKDAAIKRRPLAGHTPGEVKHILGNPVRVTKIPGQRVPEERWQYPDGSVLIFYNQLLSRVEASSRQEP